MDTDMLVGVGRGHTHTHKFSSYQFTLDVCYYLKRVCLCPLCFFICTYLPFWGRRLSRVDFYKWNKYENKARQTDGHSEDGYLIAPLANITHVAATQLKLDTSQIREVQLYTLDISGSSDDSYGLFCNKVSKKS